MPQLMHDKDQQELVCMRPDEYRALRLELTAARAALQKIADGRGMIPDKSTIYMNGRAPEVPKIFSKYDMQEIAATALENQYDNE